jgi:hypothetical protein
MIKDMSIYATNIVLDENYNPVLIKHLNKTRMDHVSIQKPPSGWGKSGSKARNSKGFNKVKKENRRLDKNLSNLISDDDN